MPEVFACPLPAKFALSSAYEYWLRANIQQRKRKRAEISCLAWEDLLSHDTEP